VVTSVLVELTDGLALDMIPVPDDADDVCPLCRSWRASGHARCNKCEQTIDELRASCQLVIPICMYSKPSEMRDRLTFYKDGNDDQRARYAPEVAAIFERFFAEHGGRLEETTGGWDVACVVPSESRRPPHPLDVAPQQLPAVNAPTREVLLARWPGDVGCASSTTAMLSFRSPTSSGSASLSLKTYTRQVLARRAQREP
jgi:hypothetical protein